MERDSIDINFDENYKFYFNKTILITGAAGSIGSELAIALSSYDLKEMILVDSNETGLFHLKNDLGFKEKSYGLEILQLNITNQLLYEDIFKTRKIDYVFHAAAYKHVPINEERPLLGLYNNIFTTYFTFKNSVKYNVEKVVLVSTDKAVNPSSVMGASKRIAEMYCQSLNNVGDTKFITTRFGNVLGSNGSVIPLFKKQLENGGPLTVTHENVTRYFMTIPEACQLVIEASTMGKGGEIYVFDMGKSIKIIDLAKKMIQLAGLEINTDVEIKITGLRPGEKMYEELLSNEENTIPTHHPKIMIGKDITKDHNSIKTLVTKLISHVENQKNEDIVKQMKEIVPEFVSNNSEFSKFDN